MIWTRQEMNKIRPIKNILYDWLINFISELIRKNIGGFKDIVISLFNPHLAGGRVILPLFLLVFP